MMDRLAELVAVSSLSRQEQAIADVVAGMLTDAGLDVVRQGCNVWCSVGDVDRPRLVLNSHLDTVPAGEGWRTDPLFPERDGERLTGLGANDAKGCVCAMIEAMLRLRARFDRGERLGGTVVLALTAEEEISGAGLSTVVDRLAPMDAALVGEPTGMVPMIAQRGLLIARVVAHGRTGHPAHVPPAVAQNAIDMAARDIAALRRFDWGQPHALLGQCHAHVTRIEGGVANNVIPDRCEFTVDIRTTPNQPHAETIARLREALEGEVCVHSERLVPVQTAREERVVQAICRALPGAEPRGSAAMSDMVFLEGVPTVKIGPGDPVRSHTPNEYITRSELEAGVEGYARIIDAYFGADA